MCVCVVRHSDICLPVHNFKVEWLKSTYGHVLWCVFIYINMLLVILIILCVDIFVVADILIH